LTILAIWFAPFAGPCAALLPQQPCQFLFVNNASDCIYCRD
jgi:hypothetical protein